jgi:hypothetical protein
MFGHFIAAKQLQLTGAANQRKSFALNTSPWWINRICSPP